MERKGGSSSSDERLADWSWQVKVKAGWCCQDCGFLGQLDKEFIDAHHIRSKSKFPKLKYDLNNGQCLCFLCHIRRHLHEPLAALLIIARLIAYFVKCLGGR